MTPMIRNVLIFSLFLASTLFIFNDFIEPANAEVSPYPLPEFTQTEAKYWINSEPLSKEDLKGKVILMDIWTFACWNCYRSFPWLNSLETKYTDKPFSIIGIHTPEFDYEKDLSAVKKKAEEFKLHHPIMMDNNFAYWKKLNNQYWPTYYLIDKKGMVRYRFIGETHADTRKSEAIESAIDILLSE